jgi:predicted aldo/keto reductase-like oxidoreductase
MAIAWVLRDPRVTSALVGARTVEQLSDTLRSLDRLDFSAEELAAIDATRRRATSTSGRFPPRCEPWAGRIRAIRPACHDLPFGT